MYCGEWIKSHALHVFMLHAPDVLGYDSANRLPPRLMVYGIEGEDFLAGDELSAPVRAAVDAVRRELRERLETS